MSHKTILLTMLMIGLAATGAAASAQAQNTSPGLIGPGSMLYGLETAFDRAAVSVGLKSVESVANERAAEALAMARANNTQGVQQALDGFAAVTGGVNRSGLQQARSILQQVRERVPAQAQTGIDTALASIGGPERPGSQAPDQERSPGGRPSGEQSPTGNETAGTGAIPETDGSGTGTVSDTDTTQDTAGTFRLYISDRPADISDFEYLNVTLSKARVYPAAENGGRAAEDDENGRVGDKSNGTAPQNATQDMSTTANGTNRTGDRVVLNTTADETDEDANVSAGTPGDGNRPKAAGYHVIDLNGSTVDLTRLVGTAAAPVGSARLPAGTYSKIELYVSSTEASVNGSSVAVKVPPGKLMLTKPFTITANTTTSFVFDIQVTLRGNQQTNNGYILRPVISQSGTAGQDVNITAPGSGVRPVPGAASGGRNRTTGQSQQGPPAGTGGPADGRNRTGRPQG